MRFVEGFPRSHIPELLAMLEEREDVINFGPGVPDFPMPDFLREEVEYRAGIERYGPVGGFKDVRELVAEYAGAEDAILTVGATEGILLLLLSLDYLFVTIPLPDYLAYTPVSILTGKKILESWRKEDTWDIEEVEKVDIVLLSNPSNPTGSLLSEEDIERVCSAGEVVIVDETYREFVYESRYISPLEACENAIVVGSFSKSLCIPGFRIGYVAGKKEVIERLLNYQMYTSLHPSTLSQHLVRVALTEKEKMRKHVREMVEVFKRRREVIWEYLRRTDVLEARKPMGAFYYFVNVKKTGLSGIEFAKRAIESGVLVVPGEEFGSPHHVRISYAVPEERIKEGMERLLSMVQQP